MSNKKALAIAKAFFIARRIYTVGVAITSASSVRSASF